MPKSDASFDPSGYAPVADRIRLFYADHPAGRIATDLVSRDGDEAARVVMRALVYRVATDPEPAASGWASEIEGDGDINTVACIENTETSAIGRALANLGYTAARERPSLEEMEKADRVRERPANRYQLRPTPDMGRAKSMSTASGGAPTAHAVTDLLDLVEDACSNGYPASDAADIRSRVRDGAASSGDVVRMERSLRRWLSAHGR